jgi:hypothetical protein
MGLATMARKKAARPRPAQQRRTIAVTLKGSEEWKEWVEAGARFCRTDVAKLFDASVVHYLKSRGFEQEAPER